MTKTYVVIFEIFVNAEDETSARGMAYDRIMDDKTYDMMDSREIPPGSSQLIIVQDINLELERFVNEDNW